MRLLLRGGRAQKAAGVQNTDSSLVSAHRSKMQLKPPVSPAALGEPLSLLCPCHGRLVFPASLVPKAMCQWFCQASRVGNFLPASPECLVKLRIAISRVASNRSKPLTV